MHPVLEKNIDENTSFCIDPVDEVFNRMKCGEEHQSMYCYFKDIQNKAVNKEL